MSFFFDDLVEVFSVRWSIEADMALSTPEMIELARYYVRLPAKFRKLFFDLARTMALQEQSQRDETDG